eukprot:CAMPEP_0206541860 /NCGR_PEP_ID=MMETSP0325_2-20121206/9851_1 /ASSEMBLY_ACC=CAM_ASM_000347 /TAXON_ID=2866 /ORGANISM="Crypthecodinium cohnii, Strain Seligo" /LENGTH=532 /DNA_ID=CAMNT_0054039853 /DNA_START=209 /DNA_END=1804 /DNA_ORIENTATION=-
MSRNDWGENWSNSDRWNRRPRGGRPDDRLKWISKQVASFSRYEEKRPYGLDADGTHGIRLKSLIQTWGNKKNVTEDDVLESMERFKFHENTSFLRFSLTDIGKGDWIIRVHRELDKVVEENEEHHPEGDIWTTTASPAREEALSVHTDAAFWETQDRLNTPPSSSRTRPASTHSREARPDRPSERSSRPSPTDRKVKGSLARHIGQRAPTPQAQDECPVETPPDLKRRALEQSLREEERRYSRHGRSRTPTGSRDAPRPALVKAKIPPISMGEKVWRWVRHILVSGEHENEGVIMMEGWAYLDDLRSVLSESRPDLHPGDSVQALTDMLVEADQEDRFEFDDQGRIRMREEPEDTEAAMRPPPLPEGRSPARSRSRSPSPAAESPATEAATEGGEGSPERRPRRSVGSRGGITPEARTIVSRSSHPASPIRVRGSIAKFTKEKAHREAPNSDYGSAHRSRSRSKSKSNSNSRRRRRSRRCSRSQRSRGRSTSPPSLSMANKKYWEMFIEKETGAKWWFYEGPKGQWWAEKPG